MARIDAMPWEDVDAIIRQRTEDQAWDDAEYDEWLDGFLSDAYEAWLDDVEVVEPTYVPFQLDASEYAECAGTLGSEIGYAESVTPFYF